MACWLHCRGCECGEYHMSGGREPLCVAQGCNSLRGIGVAAIHDYHDSDHQACLQQHSAAKGFDNRSYDTGLRKQDIGVSINNRTVQHSHPLETNTSYIYWIVSIEASWTKRG